MKNRNVEGLKLKRLSQMRSVSQGNDESEAVVGGLLLHIECNLIKTKNPSVPSKAQQNFFPQGLSMFAILIIEKSDLE